MWCWLPSSSAMTLPKPCPGHAVSIRVTWYAREDEASLAFAFKDVPLR